MSDDCPPCDPEPENAAALISAARDLIRKLESVQQDERPLIAFDREEVIFLIATLEMVAGELSG